MFVNYLIAGQTIARIMTSMLWIFIISFCHFKLFSPLSKININEKTLKAKALYLL